MATAIGDIALDFSGLSDIDPYVNGSYSNGNGGTHKVLTASLRPSASATFIPFYYTAAPSSTTIRAKVEINHDSTVWNDYQGPVLIDSSGNGYWLNVNGTAVNIQRVAAYVYTRIGASNTLTYSANDVWELELDTTNGAIKTYLNNVLVESLTDVTYSSGLRCGLASDWGNTNASGVVSFAADGYVASATIGTSDAVAIPGTDFNFTVSGGDATAGTATLSDGTNTVSVTITTYNANGACVAAIPAVTGILFDAAAVFTFIDDASGTPSVNTNFQPDATRDYIDVTDITAVGTTASVLTGYTGAAPTIGMQIVFVKKLSGGIIDFLALADTTFSASAVPPNNETTQIRAISTDGSWGTEKTYTLDVGGGGSYVGAGSGMLASKSVRKLMRRGR